MFTVKGDLNARYDNNATYISFSIQDSVIAATIEVIGWIILATFPLGV